MDALWLLVGAYLLGAVPFGYVLARAKGVDIFQVGSGNIGATNVDRALGRVAAALVLVLDVLKGWIPPVLAWHVVAPPEWLHGRQELAVAAGLAAVLGHCFSVFLGLRGGKGVASGVGVLLGAVWPLGLIAIVVFVLVMAASRFVSLASILGALSVVPGSWLLGYEPRVVMGLTVLVALIWVRHRANIGRLLAGTERRFGERAPAASSRGGASSNAEEAVRRSGANEGSPGT